MLWDEFAAAGREISWITYVSSIGSDGRPHVAPVSVAFEPGEVWFASRISSRKVRNLRANPAVAFHWPVGTGTGPGELFARGTATVHDSPDERAEYWDGLDFAYDLSAFFQSPENPDLAFVQCEITRASLLGPDFTRDVWKP